MGGLGVAVLAIILLTGIELPAFESLVPAEVVAAMAGAIGFGGAIALQLIGPERQFAGIIAVAIGMAAAVPAAWLTWRLSRAVRNMRTDATPTRQDLVGTQGVVVTQVPAGDGYGEVRVRLGGQPVKLYARAERALPAGAAVFVVEALSETSVVVEETPAIERP